jgi:membrane dipeptidase
MQGAIVIDSLYSGVYPLQWRDEAHFDEEMKGVMASGINVLGFCCSGDVAGSKFMDAINGVEYPLRHINANPDKYMIVRTANDIREAKAQCKLGFYFTHQGTNVFGSDVENVALMRQLGFGYCLLVYNTANAVGGGCADDEDIGLTTFGRKLLKAYNRYGMVVDVTHTGNRTALDACSASEQPVLASHSGAKGVFGSFRNLSDELIKAVAGTGGVCSIFTTGAYVDPTNPSVVGPEILFKHIDYMCQLIGNSDHVGYGSDWIPDMNKTMALILSKADSYPDKGLPAGTTKKAISMYGPTPMPARILPSVIDQMLTHGYSEEDCGKVLGKNVLRVFEKVWGGSKAAIDKEPRFFEDWR